MSKLSYLKSFLESINIDKPELDGIIEAVSVIFESADKELIMDEVNVKPFSDDSKLELDEVKITPEDKEEVVELDEVKITPEKKELASIVSKANSMFGNNPREAAYLYMKAAQDESLDRYSRNYAIGALKHIRTLI